MYSSFVRQEVLNTNVTNEYLQNMFHSCYSVLLNWKRKYLVTEVKKQHKET